MIATLIGCFILIGLLGYKLFQKQQLDYSTLDNYKKLIVEQQDALLKEEQLYSQLKQKNLIEQTKLKECQLNLQSTMETYNNLVNCKMQELDDSISQQRQRRQEELENTYQEAKAKYDLMLQDAIQKEENDINALLEASKKERQAISNETQQYVENLNWWKTHYDSILEPIKLYEKEKQDKIFYTIQLPDEYKGDIEFLLTTVAEKVEHPDIISKLVWAEYVKPYLDDTFKRVGVEDKSGIYKITNIDRGKAYIGKSTNVKKRIADHFKSSIGIRAIADQAVHHAILKEGFWNWAIEIITYDDKDKLNELEKYYIEFFDTQNFGYNKNSGGGG